MWRWRWLLASDGGEASATALLARGAADGPPSSALKRESGEAPGAQPAMGASPGEPRWRACRWSQPADELLSAKGRRQLAELRATPGQVERAWPWINGRRTAAEICDRLQ